MISELLKKKLCSSYLKLRNKRNKRNKRNLIFTRVN